MYKFLLFFSALFFALFAQAQISRMPVSIAYTKITAYSNRFSDAFSFAANQGALAAQKHFSAGVYSEERFSLNALRTHAAAFVLPTASGNFGVTGNYSGEQAYHESSVGLAYAKSMGSNAALGVQFNYFSVGAAGYGAASTINFDAGALFHLTPQLNAGLHVYNPVGKRWGKDGGEKLPAIYTAGLGYDVSPQVFVGMEAEKTEDQPVGLNAALHYQVAERLMARVGVQSATAVYFIGFGTKVKNLRLDVTASLHPYLGLTPGLLLLYTRNK